MNELDKWANRWPERAWGLYFDGERWLTRDRRQSSIRWARVVMMDAVGRALLPTEHVHHINGDVTDDRPENLELIDIREHGRLHGIEAWQQRKAKWQHEWAEHHPACRSCGTTERKHQAHGLCMRCDARERARARRARSKA